MSWLEEFPHSLFASALLLDNKIESWKVVNYPKKHPYDFKANWKWDRINDYTSEFKEFVVNNNEEHELVFTNLAAEYFSQWELADDFIGFKPYQRRKV